MSEFLDIPIGTIATVVTTLEMRALPPPDEPALARRDVEMRRVERPDLAWYRALFRAVGERWLWFSRLRLEDDALAAILHDPAVEVYALQDKEREIGLLELDFRDAGAVELAFLGVVPEIIGSGAGRFLMAQAMERVRRQDGPVRFWVHTCTLDHPRAVEFYVRAGFTPIRRQVEITADPRLDGTLPRDCAPGVPLI
ncbi:MAG: GNAT family N-acetyltransferase [Proteobacteria bacterium]|jgi:GNAT superfamily N-acetyltransferase|nr:MAG: GNAT family N-acetyltransferase [Pseudomonadota bacterium]